MYESFLPLRAYNDDVTTRARDTHSRAYIYMFTFLFLGNLNMSSSFDWIWVLGLLGKPCSEMHSLCTFLSGEAELNECYWGEGEEVCRKETALL